MTAADKDFARFVTEPSQPGDGPPEWPQGAAWRIVGIACPECGHESRDPMHRNAGSFCKPVRRCEGRRMTLYAAHPREAAT